jgi:hypothetical protein
VRRSVTILFIENYNEDDASGVTSPVHTANRRPHSVTAIGGLFLVAGVIGLVYHATEFKIQGPFQYDLVWVLFVRLLAIVCAVFVLRGRNWARWLLVIWIAYHIILSAFHLWSELLVHCLLLAVVAYCLFRRSASVYFHERAGPAPVNRDSL